MSRGPGRIEQAIMAAFEAEPDNAFTTEDICDRAYPGVNRIEKKHRVSVLRAMQNIVAKDNNLKLMTSDLSGGTLTI